MSTDRVGPFEVVREVTRAPGLTLVEARDPDGERRLLQLARFRAPLDDEERGARQHHERQIARQTAELVTASSEVVVHAHGGADATDGERFLFWALPWGESPLLVERAALGVEELIAIGVGLARRMARRHADGLVEPILTEHVLRMDEMGTIEVVAIPVSIDEKWRSAATPAMRLAPEEPGPGALVPSGDIWRLGRLLLALGEKTELPPHVREGFERLAGYNPEDRPRNAHEARLLLERIGAPSQLDDSVVGLDTGETAMTSPKALDPLSVTSWDMPSDRSTQPGEEPSQPVDIPNFESTTDRVIEPRVTPPVPASEMVTSQAAPLAVQMSLPTVEDARVPTTDPARLHTDPEGEPHSEELLDLSDDVVLVGEGAPDFTATHDPAETKPMASAAKSDTASTKEMDAAPATELEEAEGSSTSAPATTAPVNAAVTLDETASEMASDAAEPATAIDTAPVASAEAESKSDSVAAASPTASNSEPPSQTIPADSTKPSQATGDATSVSESGQNGGSPSESASATADAVSASDAVSVFEAASDAVSAADADAVSASDAVSVPEAASDAVSAADAVSALGAASASDADAVSASDAVSDAASASFSASATPTPAESATTPLSTSAVEPVQPPIPATQPMPAASSADLESMDDRPPIDPLAAAWEQPMLPPGESPWSEVVSTRGAHHRAHDEFPGLKGEVPVGPLPSPGRPADERPRPASYVPPPVDEVDPELVEAITGFDWRKIGAGAVVVLVMFGLLAWIARSGGEDEATDVVVAPSTNEFKLESEPSGAAVVAVRDGHVLGKTPIEFLVPNRARVEVILVASGYEPLRLDLPERGGLRAQLSKLDAEPCEVTISGVENARIEGVGFDAGEGHRISVPGAGVVRVAADQRVQGASIVYCPSLGGAPTERLPVHPKPNPTSVRLTEPAGAAAYLDGDPIGRVPTLARVQASFAHLRVDDASGMSEERWVPTAEAIEVRMPTPKPRRIPVLLIPDNMPRPMAGPPAPTTEEASAAAAEVEPATVAEPAPPRKRGPRLTRAQRRARAKRYLDEGTRAIVSENLKRAKAKLRACLRLDPNIPECNRELGTVYRRLRRPYASKQYYLKYLELRPDARDAATIRRFLR